LLLFFLVFFSFKRLSKCILRSVVLLFCLLHHPFSSRRPNNHDRNTKHGRGGRAPARDGKRAYDRRSGTGRGKEIKKGGGGAHNWGNDKDEARRNQGTVDEEKVDDAAAATTTDPAASAEEGGEGAPVVTTEGAVEEAVVAAPEPEPEDKTISYAEYMAAQAQKKKDAEAAAAPAREVENEFKGKMAAVKKTDEIFFTKEGAADKANKKGKKKAPEKEKVSLAVNFRVVRDFDPLFRCIIAVSPVL
jgi:plasminogen activator inhibitor 1 RNA-binding protein